MTLYTGTEYDNLTGYVTATYVTEWTDADGNHYRKTCTVINLGRAAPIAPIDPDRALMPDRLPGGADAVKYEYLRTAWQAAAAKRRAEEPRLIQCMVDLLQTDAPLTALEIGKRLGCHHGRVRKILRTRRDLFVFHDGNAAQWTLVGQPYTPTPKRIGSKLIHEIIAVLAAQGPLTVREIAVATHRMPTSIDHALDRQPHLFCVVSVRPAQGGTRPTRVWGLVEAGS